MCSTTKVQRFPLTRVGFDALQAELELLKFERLATIKAIAEAREHGDLSENAEYHSAREKQSFIEGRILELEGRLARADVIDKVDVSSGVVVFGANVRLLMCDDSDGGADEECSYRIVGEYESDIANGRLSVASPLARALMGKAVGEYADVVTPKGNRLYKVMSIES